MLTLQEILTRKEDQTFDCKSIQVDPKALAIPIVAFANADGGTIAIGVSDKTRKIEGIDQYANKLNELLRVPFDFCNPSVSVTCSYITCTDNEGNENRILLMDIPASPSLHTNQADEAYMRVGDKSRKLTFDEIQEMIVNACCHRAYNIKGTEIQIKMFDDRIVFESPGKLPGMVKPSNIRNTHFSRNPKIAAFLKTYHYVKEYGEGVDRMYRELEANSTSALSYRTDDFILKVTVPKFVEVAEKVTEKVAEKVTGKVAEKVAEKVTENRTENSIRLPEKNDKVADNVEENPIEKQTENRIENSSRVAEKVAENRTEDSIGLREKVTEKVIEKQQKLIEKLIEKSLSRGEKLTENKVSILRLIMDDPYISRVEIASVLGISGTSVYRNIEAMRDKYLRRVGPDKGGFWEIIQPEK